MKIGDLVVFKSKQATYFLVLQVLIKDILIVSPITGATFWANPNFFEVYHENR